MLAIIPLILLIFGSVAALIGLKSQKKRNVLLMIIISSSLTLNSFLLYKSISNRVQYLYGPITANASGLFMSEIILLLGFLIFIYSISYLKNGLNNTIYFSIFFLFLSSMVCLTLSFNIMIMYAMLEISTITSAMLILYEKTRDALKAVGIYISISLIGTIFILFGIFLLYNAIGTLTLTDFIKGLTFDHKLIIALLLTIGFGIKAGLVPAGLIWLPKAHSEAPSPVSALLSGILVQVAAFTLIRSVGIIAYKELVIFELLLSLGILSAFLGSLLAILEVIGLKVYSYQFRSDIKRVLAFSTISEVGIIIFFVGLMASVKTDVMVLLAPAIIHITNHAISKSNLFLSAGIFIHYTKNRDINLYNGLLNRFPVTVFSFILGGLSISMIPPLLGFTTIKEVKAIAGSHSYTLFIALIAIMTLICYILCFNKILKLKKSDAKGIKQEKLPMIMPILVLDIILLILGIGFFFGIFDVQKSGIEDMARTILEI